MSRERELFYGDVLAELGVTGPDRVVSQEDGEVVSLAYEAVWAYLEESNLVWWDIDENVPSSAVIPMSWIVAFHAANAFGVTGPRLERLRACGQMAGPEPSLAERMLRKLAAPAYVSEVTQVDDL